MDSNDDSNKRHRNGKQLNEVQEDQEVQQGDQEESPWILLHQWNPPKYDVNGPQFPNDVAMDTDEMEPGLEMNESDGPVKTRLLYGVEENPPIHLALLFGLQNLLLSISGCMSVPIIVTGLICAGQIPLVKAQIIGTFLVMCGVSTILQCLIGVRLPILQGGSASFLPPIIAMMSLDQWACPEAATPTDNTTTPISEQMFNSTLMNSTLMNSTVLIDDENEVWQKPMREIQGAVILSSLTQCCIGGLGLIGPLLRIIGPLTVTPCVALVGLSLTKLCISLCAKQWGIAVLSMALLFLFSLYLSNLMIPIPAFSKTKRIHLTRFPLFKLLPVILTITISWFVCAILEAAGVLGETSGSLGYGARTNMKVIQDSTWIFLPYPGQWGQPTVSVASYVGMLCATFASVVESIGDYYACARACGISQPTPAAVNRGIMIEGLGSILAGALGSGGASTSYSNNIGAIGITSAGVNIPQVGSRRAFLFAGALFIIAGIFGKFGGVLASMPEPIIGATLTVGLGVVISVALANLSYVDINSPRNQCILGVSLMMGLMVPEYVMTSPIVTGILELDQALSVMLGTPMFVGGVLACFLDNTVPGSEEERGIAVWRTHALSGAPDAPSPDSETYDVPYISKLVKKNRFFSKLPFL